MFLVYMQKRLSLLTVWAARLALSVIILLLNLSSYCSTFRHTLGFLSLSLICHPCCNWLTVVWLVSQLFGLMILINVYSWLDVLSEECEKHVAVLHALSRSRKSLFMRPLEWIVHRAVICIVTHRRRTYQKNTYIKKNCVRSTYLSGAHSFSPQL